LAERDPEAPRSAGAIPAQRCAECHGDIHEEWKRSAHAHAATDPLFAALQKKAPPGAPCDRCHRPLAAVLGREEAPVEEGVTCDVCHALRVVVPSRALTPLQLRLEDNVKYGPICDAKDHYFHRMGCSPLHAEAAFCGGCHLWWAHDLPIFNEFEEWKTGPLAAEGRACQGCHMPTRRAEVAVGGGARAEVHAHGFLGQTGDLRKRALAGQVTVAAAEGGALQVTVQLRNRGAGHPVPTGLPERRVILSARTVDAAGAEIDRKEVRYGRVLVDGAGKPAPFFAAAHVASDNRIGPRTERQESLTLRAPPKGKHGKLIVDVNWVPFDPELAASLGVPRGVDQPMLHGEIPVGDKLPKTFQVKP
jgi:hypothetical protein